MDADFAVGQMVRREHGRARMNERMANEVNSWVVRDKEGRELNKSGSDRPNGLKKLQMKKRIEKTGERNESH